MKQLKNFLIKREQSRTGSGFAECEKSRLLAKTILTLVALLAVTTGAWAQEETLLTTITATGTDSYSETTTGVVTVSLSNVGFFSEDYGWCWFKSGSVTVEAKEGYTITKCVFKQNTNSPVTITTSPFAITFKEDGYYEDLNGATSIEVYGYAPSSGPEVAWDKTTKTGSFTMPGGNVTLEPEYYPQAELATGGAPTAINDVPATTDGAIVKAGTVASIGETTNAQGTLMYYVSQSALDDAALLALAADKWTADVPTAAHLAEGQAYVYYYVRGNDSDTDAENFSDGDILAANALTVTIAAEPTYAVTFADDTAEPTLWTADPNADVTKGQTVTVTYTGSKKVIGVKAEKKAATALLSAATTDDIGKVVCAVGHLHDAKTAVPDGCTAVGILGKVTETGHGLILSLQNATQQNFHTINGWTSASYAGTTLKVLPDADARGNLSSYETLGETAVSNWAVAQKSDYEPIFINLGSTNGDSDGFIYDGNVNAYITTGVGGAALDGRYWSATEDSGYGWDFNSSYWNLDGKSGRYSVRPVLGF